MFKRKRVEYLDRNKFVSVVGDGAISTGRVGEGRMIPLVIVDATNRPDLVEVVRLNKEGLQGDVTLNWATLNDAFDEVGLVCRFVRPVEAECVIVFNVDKQGILVEQALAHRGLYFQPGAPGDRLKNTWDTPRIIMEIPDMEFRQAWYKIYFKSVVKQLRAKGFDRAEAKRGAESVIKQLRDLGNFRMPTK
jgi:hypothetical protein